MSNNFDELGEVKELVSNKNKLHDWQEKAMEFFFSHKCQAIFECGTGTGKTRLAIELIGEVWKRDPEVNFLIVVPKNVILETGWYKELSGYGISIADIGAFYGLAKEYGKVTLTNMQNLDDVEMERFDGIIFDEVHTYTTSRLLEVVKKPFKYKIGLSATIEKTEKKHWQLLGGFNYNVFTYGLKEAIKDDIINQFDFVNVGIVMDEESKRKYDEINAEINAMIASFSFKGIMSRDNDTKYSLLKKITERNMMVNNYYGKFAAINRICQRHDGKKILIFNQYNEQTNKCYWHLLEVGVAAKIMHSGLDNKTRQKNLSDYAKGVFNVLLTSRVLDEGYNLPSIDVGIIMAGNSTERQTVQRMGRILRKKLTSSFLYQIYCIDTIEEKYAMKKTNLFKPLCLSYKEIVYQGEKDGKTENQDSAT